MPFDNLENFIKENIEAVQHTPPPGTNWNPEAAWLELQQSQVPVRKKSINWLYYAAAVLILAVLSGIMRQHWLSSKNNPQPLVASKAPQKILPATALPPAPTDNPAGQITNSTGPTITLAPPKPEVAAGKLKKSLTKAVKLQVASTRKKPAEELILPGNVPDTEKKELTAGMPANAVPESTAPGAAIPPPLKITVVLGGVSSAKMQIAAAAKNRPAENRKLRFRINAPGNQPTDNEHIAATDRAHKPLTLQARIDL